VKRQLRISRADATRLEVALRGARFENIDPRPEVIAAIGVLRLYFQTWVEARIEAALLHIVGMRDQRWSGFRNGRGLDRSQTREALTAGTTHLRVSQLDAGFLRKALASARFEKADDSEEFVAAATLMREFIATEIIAPLVTTIEHITGRIPQ